MTRSTPRWLLFGVALAAQLIALYAPRAPSEGSGWGLDKVVHASLFAAVVWTGRRVGFSRWWLALICAVHAPVSELVQWHFLAHRDGSVGDALADLTGVLIGAALPSTPSGPSGRSRGRMSA